MGYKKEYKDYIVTRKTWWKFWQVDSLTFILPTNYNDAYEEVERKTMNGHTWSMELMDWVKDDVREQLKSRIITYPDLVTKAKNHSVQFGTGYNGQRFTETMKFYLRGDIYFDSDEAIKREKLLNKLGI